MISRVALTKARMQGELPRRQLEDQPAAARIHVREAEHIPEERAGSLGVLRVDDRVDASDHFGQPESRRCKTSRVTSQSRIAGPHAPVAQWIERGFPKPGAKVRFLPGAPPLATAALSTSLPNHVVSASRSPASVPSPTQATCPSGRTKTAVGAPTSPSTGSSQAPAYEASTC